MEDKQVLNSLYRWCDGYGGGLVIATSIEDAKEKLIKKYKDEKHALEFTIWPWKNDDYFDEENDCVFDIY